MSTGRETNSQSDIYLKTFIYSRQHKPDEKKLPKVWLLALLRVQLLLQALIANV